MHSGFVLFAVIALCHIGVSFVINRVPYRNIAKIRPRMMPGNKECDFYKRGLHINAWKDYVPSVGPFDKKTLKANSAEYYSLFILETIRAEMAHVFCILITLLVLYLYKPSYPFAIPLLMKSCFISRNSLLERPLLIMCSISSDVKPATLWNICSNCST